LENVLCTSIILIALSSSVHGHFVSMGYQYGVESVPSYQSSLC